jgi:hypothetical protein
MANDIKVDDLRRYVTMILDHIEHDLHITQVPLTQNFYWDVASDALYTCDKEQPVCDIGSLVDDLDFLSKMRNQQEAVALMLIHAAPLLRYVGEKIGQ